MTEILWLGHATFFVKTNGISILIDPWLDNPKAPSSIPDEVKTAQYILVTHGHFDHFIGAMPLVKENANGEIITYCKSQGVPEERVVPMNKGGTVQLEKGNSVTAEHSSSITTSDGQSIYAGEPLGFIINTADEHHIYYSGDTAVFGDMGLINDMYKPDVAIVCCGGNYTMDAAGAAYAIDKYFTNVKVAIPMHYGTFPILKSTGEDFKNKVTRKDCEVTILEIGAVKKFFESSCIIM